MERSMRQTDDEEEGNRQPSPINVDPITTHTSTEEATQTDSAKEETGETKSGTRGP